MKPLDVFQMHLRRAVTVEVKGGRRYRGTLDGFDQHMNLVLIDAVELNADGSTTPQGTTLFRGDSVLFMSP